MYLYVKTIPKINEGEWATWNLDAFEYWDIYKDRMTLLVDLLLTSFMLDASQCHSLKWLLCMLILTLRRCKQH